MSSSDDWRKPQTNNSRNDRRRGVQGISRNTQGGQSSETGMLDPSEMLISTIPYRRGTKFDGPGIDPCSKTNKLQGNNKRVFHRTGKGTAEAPMVGWLFDCMLAKIFSNNMRLDHVDIVRNVAVANGFECALIRKQAHPRQCTYNKFGTRNMKTGANGRQRPEALRADSHITIYMGPNEKTALVGGHIYVIEVADSEAGKVVLKQMDDPETQRKIVHEGYEKVAEEFWHVKFNAWVTEKEEET
ncbi:hypothetical protein C8A03DRAFT_35220 [Achaetomium macrosporum]|uniref:Uncharacterized protein n=1 Tax=Achaetomium macrosporum TaxID=79813 RepID=A0AAN7H656_9PEZI|nr:hypothetical protein C8A03DRAFT_35220 [Achaetomium macrosporum]